MTKIALALTGVEADTPLLIDTVNFLYDFNLTYELSRLATDPRYEGFRYSRFVLYRNGRPLDSEDRLAVDVLQQASPLKLVAWLTATSLAIGSIWAVVQIAQVVSNWPLEHRKTEAEARKAELEVLKLEKELGIPSHETRFRASDRPFIGGIWNTQAEPYILQLVNRLERSPVRIENVEIKIVEDNERQ